MKSLKSRWLAIGLGFAVLAGFNDAQAQDKKEKKEKPAKPAAKPNQKRPVQTPPSQNRPAPERQGSDRVSQSPRQGQPSTLPPAQEESRQKPKPVERQESKTEGARNHNAKVPDSNPSPSLKNAGAKNSGAQIDSTAQRKVPPVKLTEERKSGEVIEKKRPSGRLAETVKVDQKTGEERIQRLSPTGRKESEAIKTPDGTIRKAHYDLGGVVKKEEVVHKDGSKQVTDHRIGRDGNFRAKETVTYNVNQKVVSKTVEKNVTINNNITINKSVNRTVVVNHYDRGRYGFVYRPVYLARPRLFVSWYDPYWYTPVGVVIHRPFRWTWGWERHGWYSRYHGCYWSTYTVYPAPSYWVTDYMVAAYVADHHAATVSAAQAREEARLAREEAQKARLAAEDARDQAEIAEAKAAAAQAELRAKNAEERAAKAERQQASAGKNPNTAPIDPETKEALRGQIEKTIAEQKMLAEQSEKTGKPVLPDLSKSFANPKHIYPVSKTISVVSAKDDAPAGILSEGDLLRVEPGQENVLKDADENTEVLMRVMSSKGEENEVAAGTVVKVFVKDLQEFDSEFRAKLDEGLVAAETNKDQFKQGLVAQKN